MSNPFEDPPASSAAAGGRRDRNKPYKPITRAPAQPRDEWAAYEAQIEQSMQSTLDSTKRSMMMLEESEQTGLKTAETLVTQGEQLRNTDRNLDEINAATVQTQRNLNNIKSVFGGIKNYFSKKPADTSSGGSAPAGLSKKAAAREEAGAARLPATIGETRTAAMAPAPAGASLDENRTLSAQSRAAIAGTRWEAMDREVDENLDLMSANLRRLQGLGSALGDEVERQNEMLDRIGSKTDKADATIRTQDKQMQRILGVNDTPSVSSTDPNIAVATTVAKSASWKGKLFG